MREQMINGKRVTNLVVASLLASCIILINIYPYRPNSLVGWILVFVFSLPVCVILELIGDKVLGVASSFSRFSGIIYGVIALGLLFALFALGASYFDLYFGRWGYQ